MDTFQLLKKNGAMSLVRVGGKMQPLLVAVCLLALIAALFVIFRTIQNSPPEFDLRSFAIVGEVTAQETAKLLGHKGNIAVLTMDAASLGARITETEAKAFSDALKKETGITLTAVGKIPGDPLTLPPPGTPLPAGGLPSLGASPEALLRILQEHPDLDAVVSFAGFPQMTPDQISSLKPGAPKFVVVSTPGKMEMGLKKLLEDQVVHLAVIQQIGPPPEAAKRPKTPREWFDCHYKLVTPETAASLPY